MSNSLKKKEASTKGWRWTGEENLSGVKQGNYVHTGGILDEGTEEGTPVAMGDWGKPQESFRGGPGCALDSWHSEKRLKTMSPFREWKKKDKGRVPWGIKFTQ